MLRKNPDAFALAAITLVMLAVTAVRLPVPAPQPRWVVAPIRAKLLANRQCIREGMQAHREAIRQTVHAIAQTFHHRY